MYHVWPLIHSASSEQEGGDGGKVGWPPETGGLGRHQKHLLHLQIVLAVLLPDPPVPASRRCTGRRACPSCWRRTGEVIDRGLGRAVGDVHRVVSQRAARRRIDDAAAALCEQDRQDRPTVRT